MSKHVSSTRNCLDHTNTRTVLHRPIHRYDYKKSIKTGLSSYSLNNGAHNLRVHNDSRYRENHREDYNISTKNSERIRTPYQRDTLLISHLPDRISNRTMEGVKRALGL